MKKRKSFEEIYMNFAHEISERSYDDTMKVGCIITSHDFRQVFSLGFNGNASGLPNKKDSDKPGESGFIHAELNSCISCNIPRYVDKVVFCTHSPCKLCAKALVNLGGVKKFYYKEKYRDDTGLRILKACGIIIKKL